MEIDCLTTNFVSETTSSLVGDVANFASDMSNPASVPPWTSNYNGTAEICAFDQPDLGPLGVNWMSPQYQDNIDWDALLAGFVVNARTYDQNRGTNVDGRPPVLQNAYQESSQPLQQPSETESTRAYNVTASAPASVPIEGRYYVDGTGARAPFGGRVHGRGSVEANENERHVESGDMVSPSMTATHSLCSQAAYANLVRQVVSGYQCHGIDLSNTTFPVLNRMQHYVHLYFEFFYPIFPFIRKVAFGHMASTEWVLLLAVATVGSRYMRREEGRIPGDLLFAILDATLKHLEYGYKEQGGDEHIDATFVPTHQATTSTCPSLPLLQAGILNIMLLQHSNKKALVERSFIERHYLVEACHSLDLLSCTPGDRDMQSATCHRQQESIDNWIVRETGIRVGMMIWVTNLSLFWLTIC
jgi:hypothetical protein